jgi:hypothetical protein
LYRRDLLTADYTDYPADWIALKKTSFFVIVITQIAGWQSRNLRDCFVIPQFAGFLAMTHK